MTTRTATDGIKAKAAAELAGITYRQLDHWARQGWITPSVQTATGRGGRRLYSVDDVVRLAALRAFATAGWPIADLGEQLKAIDLASTRFVVATSKDGLQGCADVEELLTLLRSAQQCSVLDLHHLLAAITGDSPQEVHATDVA